MISAFFPSSMPESSASAISTKVLGVTMMQPEAVTIGFTPPPISGMSTTGGFEGFIQMRGAGTSQDLEATANAFVAEATSRDENGQPKYPAIGTLRSLFSTGAPQLYANLDRERCKDMGISISDVFTAMNATFGALYVNDFNYLGRTFQVRMQAEADYRLLPESLHDIFVRTNKGGMVRRLAALLHIPQANVACVGDHANDISMLTWAGMAFAPANALPEVRALPCVRTLPDCREDAIAALIAVLDEKF